MQISFAKRIPLAFCLFLSIYSYAQDSLYVRQTVSKLTAETFWGRGYTRNGMANAADFLSAEYKKIGLLPMGEQFKQIFSFPVNTFPGKMLVELNGKKLIPGKDFIVDNESPSVTVSTKLQQLDSVTYSGGSKIKVVIKDKLTWSVASAVGNETIVQINKKSIEETPKTISATIENKFIPNFSASNVCGIIKGTKYPDSVLMITAHYDHLGGMGAYTYFPGANDNAAGVATLLSLAKYYVANPPPYSVGFICFAAEEAGLLGSRYFTEKPTVSLSNIKFLINLDLVGTGESGMTVVNATIYPKAFSILNEINAEQKLISKINSRGKAANSDHYFFTEKGVPAFFFYTQGGISAYHDVFDKAETLPLTEYRDLFKLIVSFNKKMMQ